MKRRLLSAFLAVVMIFSMLCGLTSCSEDKEFPVTIGEVKIDAEPESIVILDKNLMDIVSCIEYDVKLIGRSNEVNQEGLDVVPQVGSKNDPNPDKILGLGADLVLADTTMTENVKDEIEKRGIKVVQFDTAQTMTQLKNLYENIGRALGGNITGVKDANEAYKNLKKNLDNIKYAANADEIVETACYLYVDNGVLKSMNSATWCGAMLDETGAINVFAHSETDVVDNEQLLLSNPDYIFCSDNKVVSHLNNSSLYTLDALESNTFVIPYEDISMQGYTALDVIETMFKCMHPEQFNEDNTDIIY